MGWQLARLERGHSGKEYTCDNTLDSTQSVVMMLMCIMACYRDAFHSHPLMMMSPKLIPTRIYNIRDIQTHKVV